MLLQAITRRLDKVYYEGNRDVHYSCESHALAPCFGKAQWSRGLRQVLGGLVYSAEVSRSSRARRPGSPFAAAVAYLGVAQCSAAAFISLLVLSNYFLRFCGGSFQAASAADMVALIAAVGGSVLILSSFFLVVGLGRELREARDASVNLARATIACEALLRSPSAASVVASAGGCLDQEAGLDVLPSAVREASASLVCEDRFQSSGTATRLLRYVRDDLSDAVEHTAGKSKEKERDHIDPNSEEARKSTGVIRIMEEILGKHPGMCPDDPEWTARAEKAARVASLLDGAGKEESIWANMPSKSIIVAGCSEATEAQVFIHPIKQFAMAMAIEADEVLSGRLYADVQDEALGRFPLQQMTKKQEARLDRAFEWIGALYSCNCQRAADKYSEEMGWPDNPRHHYPPAGSAPRDLAICLKRAVCYERVSLMRGREGVIVDNATKWDLEHYAPVDVDIAPADNLAPGAQPSDAQGQWRLCHKVYYDENGVYTANGFGGLNTLFRDIGRAELLLAPIFFAKVFLRGDFKDKRRVGIDATDAKRPPRPPAYGPVKFRVCAALIGVCSVGVLSLSSVSAFTSFATALASFQQLATVSASFQQFATVSASFQQLATVSASFQQFATALAPVLSALFLGCLDTSLALFSVVVGIVSLGVACRFFNSCDRDAQGIIDNFPAIKRYFPDGGKEDFAVNRVENFVAKCPQAAPAT